jgi:hypothetical protein
MRSLLTAALVLVSAVALGLVLVVTISIVTRQPGSAGVPVDAERVWFEDVTDEVGLRFVHDPGPTGDYFMPQSVGSGCAVIHDGDDLYLYLLNNAGPDSASVNRLYRRTAAGTFEDVTAGSGLDVAGFNMGVAVGDVNNDGRPDVLLTQYGGIKLFLNRGGGRFRDATAAAGLSNPRWGVSAAFVDYDRDGWLDLVVVNYVDYDPKPAAAAVGRDFPGPASFANTNSKLFRNLGPAPPGVAVRFQDVTESIGIGGKSGPGLGVVCADFDGDGYPDIFVANDGKPNHLWMSSRAADGGVVFKEEAGPRGIAYAQSGRAYAGMGVATGDVRNEGMFDLFVTHLNFEPNNLWRQERPGQFQDRTPQSGLDSRVGRGTGFGTVMADFDLDGFLDIAVVNGGVIRKQNRHATGLSFWEPYADHNQLLANDGGGRFRDVSPSNASLCGNWNVGRGLACADFDGDGAPDLLVTAIGGRARLLRNVAPNRGHWLTVRAFDPRWRRDAYGAEVRVQAGGCRLLRLVSPAGSYLSSGSPFAHFGLGHADRIDKILVKWPDGPPDGAEEEFDGGAIDRAVVLTRGTGRQVSRAEDASR